MTLQSSPAARPNLSVNNWRSYVTLFRTNPQFTRLWLAGVISQFGNWFNYIAIFVLLQQLSGSGKAISWFLIAKFIPTAVLGPAAGVLADRFSRKAIMIGCDLLRVGIVLCFLLITRPEQVWLVYGLALLQESLWTFADPARRASVPNLCRSEELNLANALSGATWSIMLAFGAALGGFTTAYFGWRTAIVFDAATFLISGLMISGLTLPPLPSRQKGAPSWRDYLGLNDLVEGVQYVARHRQVAALLLVKSGWALSGGILVMLTVFGEQVFAAGHGQGSNSGILYSTRGLGAAVGPLLAWRLFGESRPAMSRAIGYSFFVASGSYLLFSPGAEPGLGRPFRLLRPPGRRGAVGFFHHPAAADGGRPFPGQGLCRGDGPAHPDIESFHLFHRRSPGKRHRSAHRGPAPGPAVPAAGPDLDHLPENFGGQLRIIPSLLRPAIFNAAVAIDAALADQLPAGEGPLFLA